MGMVASNSSASVSVSPCLPPPIATGARGRRVPLSTCMWKTRSRTERGRYGRASYGGQNQFFGRSDVIVAAEDATHDSAPPPSPAPLPAPTATRSLSASPRTNLGALSSSPFRSSSTHPVSASNTSPNASTSPPSSSCPPSTPTTLSSSPSSPAAASTLTKSLKLGPIFVGTLVPLLVVAVLGAASIMLYRRRQRLGAERRARTYVWLPGAPAASLSYRSAGIGTGYGSAVLLVGQQSHKKEKNAPASDAARTRDAASASWSVSVLGPYMSENGGGWALCV